MTTITPQAGTPEAGLPGRRLGRSAMVAAIVAGALILVLLLVAIDGSSSSTPDDRTPVPAAVDGSEGPLAGSTSADAAERHATAVADRCVAGAGSVDAMERCLTAP